MKQVKGLEDHGWVDEYDIAGRVTRGKFLFLQPLNETSEKPGEENI